MTRRTTFQITATLLALVIASGCGSSSDQGANPGVSATWSQDCSPQTETSEPGNFDRFSFTTETSEGSFVGFKNGKGDVVIKPTFGFAYEFGEGGVAAAVIRPTELVPEARAVFIDPTGKELAQALMFDNGPDYYQNGYARIVNGEGLIGFIDRTGKVVLQPQFIDAQSFCEGKALVRDETSEWQIDISGKRLTEKAAFEPVPDELD